ncbi:hypothetical protein MRX96_002874 [Rhipicephalus microplus]
MILGSRRSSRTGARPLSGASLWEAVPLQRPLQIQPGFERNVLFSIEKTNQPDSSSVIFAPPPHGPGGCGVVPGKRSSRLGKILE